MSNLKCAALRLVFCHCLLKENFCCGWWKSTMMKQPCLSMISNCSADAALSPRWLSQWVWAICGCKPLVPAARVPQLGLNMWGLDGSGLLGFLSVVSPAGGKIVMERKQGGDMWTPLCLHVGFANGAWYIMRQLGIKDILRKYSLLHSC